MFDKLKQQPLLGLTLAITAGYVLAHIITRALDITYEDALGSDPMTAAQWLGALAFAGLVAWKRGAIITWAKGHKRKLAWSAAAAVCLMSALAWRGAVIDARGTQKPVTIDPSTFTPLPKK